VTLEIIISFSKYKTGQSTRRRPRATT